MTRIYQNQQLTVNAEIALDEKASHYLSRVLRSSIGDSLVLFNGQGGEYCAQIQQITKKQVTVLLSSFSPREAESPIQITLAQGLARGEKMDFIIQKAVELGVKHIIPLMTERCNVKLEGDREEKRVQHWQSVAISACEQSGRNIVPIISAPISLREWVLQAQAERCFVLSPHVANKLNEEKLADNAHVMLLIGPEGGLSEVEIKMAEGRGFLALNLGPRVLRTETAPLAAIAMLQTKYGDF